MVKILTLSDDGLPTGYGRISAEVNKRLIRRGYQIVSASLTFDGLLPPQYDGEPLPYWVASLAGKNYPDEVLKLVNAHQPDIIWVTQDFPYAVNIRNLPLDWSRYGFMITTPVDGAPIYPLWVNTMKQADAGLTISEFGVQAFKQQGVSVGLCRPGINLDKFYRLNDDQRRAIRERLNIAPDAFVLGVMCMNQGRKSIPQMMKAFFDFAQDKPAARLLLDMDAVSPAGWDLQALAQQYGWDASKVIYRIDALRAGIHDLRDRYNACDAHAVLSFREGYGLPISEAMACGVVSIAMDYCSGTEQLANNRGILVKPIDYFLPSTWGGALDMLPDYKDMTASLQWLHDNPAERQAMAARGMAWAREQTWDKAADAAQAAIESVLQKRKPVVQKPPMYDIIPSMTQVQPDGVKQVQLVEA